MKVARHEDTFVLAEKVVPGKTALVVVDYQNDFVAEGGALDKAGKSPAASAAIHDRIVETIEMTRDAGARIVFLRCEYSTPDNRVLSDVVAGYRQEWHEKTLDVIDWRFGEVVTLDDLREVWK